MSYNIIETDNLTKKYGEQECVSNLDIHVKKGRIYGLLGRNGAGKTTTMKRSYKIPKVKLKSKKRSKKGMLI